MNSVAFLPLWNFHIYLVELIFEDTMQIEKSKELLYQFLGWVEVINNWGVGEQRVLKHVYVVQK